MPNNQLADSTSLINHWLTVTRFRDNIECSPDFLASPFIKRHDESIRRTTDDRDQT